MVEIFDSKYASHGIVTKSVIKKLLEIESYLILM